MPTALRPPPLPTTALLRERIQILFRHLPRALGGNIEGIHQLRVASRRLRAALPLVAGRPKGRRVRRADRVARQIVRAAGPSRDLDVTVELFLQHLPQLDRRSPEIRTLRRRLLAARRRGRQRMIERLLDLDVAGFRRDLRGILARGGQATVKAQERLREFRDVEGLAILARLVELGDRFDPENLHQFRSRTRRLRYTAEVAAHLRRGPVSGPRPLKQIQERLGSMHDAFVLSRWLGGQAEAAERRGASALASAARDLEDYFLARSREHHQEFLAGNPAGIIRRALAGMIRTDSAA